MDNIIKFFKTYISISIGTTILAAGLHFFLFPNKITSGGVSGLALILSTVFNVSSSLIITISNTFLFILSFIVISGSFGIKSIYSSILMSVALSLFELFFPNIIITDDLIIATIFGSLCIAIGSTVNFMNGASTGGTEIVGRIIYKYFHIGVGMSSFIADAFVTVLAFFTFNIELGLYGMLSIYIVGFMVDKFVDGFNSRKQIMIITKNKDLVLNYILKDFDRGCTIFKGTGGYSGEDKNILVTILNRSQFVTLRKFLKKEDPTSFVTVTDVIKVFGEGFDQLH